MLVQTSRPPRFNGELMRGFGLTFDGVDRFTTTTSVGLGGVTISRAVYVNRGANYGRWVDSFTNTTDRTLTIKVAFGGQSGIVGHISICDDVVIGGATMVSKDIREPGFYTASFPAEKDRDWKRKVARFRRLDELVRRVATLEKDDHGMPEK